LSVLALLFLSAGIAVARERLKRAAMPEDSKEI
jgi:hypothetical protein